MVTKMNIISNEEKKSMYIYVLSKLFWERPKKIKGEESTSVDSVK